MTEKQPEALRLAVWLEHRNMGNITPSDLLASAELRRLHAEHEKLTSIVNGLLRESAVKDTELEALRKNVVPYGYKLVPLEPSVEMLQAGRDTPLAGESDDDALDDYRAVYRAMLAAAPAIAQALQSG